MIQRTSTLTKIQGRRESMKETITALDVENKSFARSIRGYDPVEVDEFLDSVAESLQECTENNKRLEQEKHLVEEQLKESLQDALLMAQQSADDKVNSAKEKGEAIIAEARARSEHILFEADNEREKIRRDIKQLKSYRQELNSELKSLIARFESYLQPETEKEASNIMESSG